MKKLYFLILLFTLATGAVMAQTSSVAKGDSFLNLGIGIGSPFFGSGYKSAIPVNPTLTFEKAATNLITIGGTISYASSKFDYSTYGLDNDDYESKLNALFIGARAAYHFNEALKLDSKYDFYGGVSLGYVAVSSGTDSEDDEDEYDDEYGNQYNTKATASGIGYALFLGGRYYFAPKTSLYAELGYTSLSILNIGVSFKL